MEQQARFEPRSGFGGTSPPTDEQHEKTYYKNFRYIKAEDFFGPTQETYGFTCRL